MKLRTSSSDCGETKAINEWTIDRGTRKKLLKRPAFLSARTNQKRGPTYETSGSPSLGLEHRKLIQTRARCSNVRNFIWLYSLVHMPTAWIVDFYRCVNYLKRLQLLLQSLLISSESLYNSSDLSASLIPSLSSLVIHWLRENPSPDWLNLPVLFYS